MPIYTKGIELREASGVCFGILRAICPNRITGDPAMNNLLYKAKLPFLLLVLCEDAQDLVEYSLVVALVAFAVVAGLHNLAFGISAALSNVGLAVATSIT